METSSALETAMPKPLPKRTVTPTEADVPETHHNQTTKRPRNNKAKQGRPSHLSTSQKRKLVRLYVYTNLSLDDIRKLIEQYGSQPIQYEYCPEGGSGANRERRKRALQYVLSTLLCEHYNHLRPKNESSSRERVRQAENTKVLRAKTKETTQEDDIASISAQTCE